VNVKSQIPDDGLQTGTFVRSIESIVPILPPVVMAQNYDYKAIKSVITNSCTSNV
jgi:hypothetical protein